MTQAAIFQTLVSQISREQDYDLENPSCPGQSKLDLTDSLVPNDARLYSPCFRGRS